jgi:excisionase family DNA binding protein
MRKSPPMIEPEADTIVLQKLLTPKQAAAVLAISDRKLWAMTASREIAHVRIGERGVRYSPSDLEAWIEANTVPARA